MKCSTLQDSKQSSNASATLEVGEKSVKNSAFEVDVLLLYDALCTHTLPTASQSFSIILDMFRSF